MEFYWDFRFTAFGQTGFCQILLELQGVGRCQKHVCQYRYMDIFYHYVYIRFPLHNLEERINVRGARTVCLIVLKTSQQQLLLNQKLSNMSYCRKASPSCFEPGQEEMSVEVNNELDNNGTFYLNSLFVQLCEK